MKFVAKLFPILVLFLAVASAAGQLSDRDRGIDLYREGRFTEAIELLEKSLAANENDRSAWIYLGGAYVHIGRHDAAVKAFGKKTDPKLTVPPTKFEKSVKVTYKPRAIYTEAARRRGSSGTVRIAVEFRADGTIGFVFPLLTTLDPDLVGQSMEAAKGIKFEPAIKDGKPVTAINLVEYGFFIG